jgi:hypothetical protein
MTAITWFKHPHDLPQDPRWRTVARRAGAKVGEVVSIIEALFCFASKHPDRGCIEGFDIEVIADLYDYEISTVVAIVRALNEKEVIVAGRLVDWAQIQGENVGKLVSAATLRMRRFRAKQKHETRQLNMLLSIDGSKEAGVTRDVTGVTKRHRASHPPSPSPTDLDSDKDLSLSNESDARAGARCSHMDDFAKFWEVYPHRVDEPGARKAFAVALQGVGLDELVAVVRRYCASKPVDREWCNPATWLRRKRWLDQPAAPAGTVSSPMPSSVRPIPPPGGPSEEALRRAREYRAWCEAEDAAAAKRVA